MINHQAFVDQEQSIYQKSFAKGTTLLEQQGIKPSSALVDSQSGYLVAVRHPPAIVDRVAAFSQRVASVVPAIVYDDKNMHATVATYQIDKGIRAPDSGVLRAICQQLTPFSSQRPLIMYGTPTAHNWYANSDTVIVGGSPALSFTDLIDRVTTPSSDQSSLVLKPTWGSHITAARFTEARSSDQVKDLVALLKEAPIVGESQVTSLDVGFFTFTKDGFTYTVHDRFFFKQ